MKVYLYLVYIIFINNNNKWVTSHANNASIRLFKPKPMEPIRLFHKMAIITQSYKKNYKRIIYFKQKLLNNWKFGKI